LWLVFGPFQEAGAAVVPQRLAGVLRSRCLECHAADDPSGDVDLSVVLSPKVSDSASLTKLWTRVEKMVASGKMPPKDEQPLSKTQRDSVLAWYRENYVLRDDKEHIGPTPLRRLTRYELENTLEELLQIRLKQPYVFSPQSAGLLPSTIERLYPADTAGQSGFDNDAVRLRDVKVPMEKYLACVDYALRVFGQSSEARQKLFGFSDKSTKLAAADAERIVNRFARRASRGYENSAERKLILAAYLKSARKGTSYQALRDAARRALVSPSFLYRLEVSRESKQPYEVSLTELATRLSYFLWASMPDEELFRVAEDGSLGEEAVLRKQVERMLDSPKRIALAENFAGQWLGFDGIKRNPVYYRGEKWTRGVYDELLFSFDELIKSDRSILEIVDADWVYVRPELHRGTGGRPKSDKARFADIFAERRSREGLQVEAFYRPPELRSVKNNRLGGMITSTGILRVTSSPNETKPIRRGVWLLETIIGEEMKPPDNVPPLSESQKKLGKQKATGIAEILKLHTEKPACRSCHQHIDPLGLGLENFSPIGRWRTAYKDRKPVRSGGVLPNGRKFSSPKQLKQELLTFYRQQIVDNMIRKMMAYALGRKMQPHDRPTIKRIHDELVKNDYRMFVLIEQIVMSPQFRKRQDQ